MKDELGCGIYVQIEPAVGIRCFTSLEHVASSPSVLLFLLGHLSLSHSGCAVEDVWDAVCSTVLQVDNKRV